MSSGNQKEILRIKGRIIMAMKYYTLEEMEDRHIGKIGTPERNRYEQELSDELHAYHLGEAIREARLSRNMTQEQLGEKVGVQKSRISRLERGGRVSLSSMARIFKAMNIPLSLEIGGVGKVALW
jgi:ribosome-binding protein aMBF1 (putative translation factor)